MSGVAAIILAAGLGRRFGSEPKLLASLDGKPLVRHVAETALASRAHPVLTVLGHQRAAVGEALAGLDLRLVENPAYAYGLSTSLKAGFAALPAQAGAAVVLLADMPRVTATVVDHLIAAWEAAPDSAAVVPVHAGRRGNPVLLGRTLAGNIADLSGDAGAGPLLRARADVIELPIDDPAVLADVDTPAALGSLPKPGAPIGA